MHAASACTRKLAITGGQSSQQTIYYIGIREIPLLVSVCHTHVAHRMHGSRLKCFVIRPRTSDPLIGGGVSSVGGAPRQTSLHNMRQQVDCCNISLPVLMLHAPSLLINKPLLQQQQQLPSLNC